MVSLILSTKVSDCTSYYCVIGVTKIECIKNIPKSLVNYNIDIQISLNDSFDLDLIKSYKILNKKSAKWLYDAIFKLQAYFSNNRYHMWDLNNSITLLGLEYIHHK